MLKPAQLFEGELNEKMINTWYKKEYMWYHGARGGFTLNLPDNSIHTHYFASVDEKTGQVIGMIGYAINRDNLTAENWTIISFDQGNMIFVEDIKTVIYDVFLKYGLQRMVWYCYADNPAVRGYRNFIKRFGGRECAYFRNFGRLMDGKLHDGVYFELLADEFFAHYAKVIAEL